MQFSDLRNFGTKQIKIEIAYYLMKRHCPDLAIVFKDLCHDKNKTEILNDVQWHNLFD